MSIVELRTKRSELIAKARAIHNKAETEKRNPTTEERAEFDALFNEADALATQIETLEQDEQRRIKLKNAEENEKRSAGRVGEQTTVTPGDRDEYRAAFASYLRTGHATRNLQADSDPDGGYMVAPKQMATAFISLLNDRLYLRSLATVLPALTSAASIGVVSLDADIADFDWTDELNTGDEDTAMSLGGREMTPHPAAKLVKISNKLLRLSPNVEMLVNDRLAYVYAKTMEKALLTGNGSGQPLGVFTASDLGIPTSRDVSTDNTTTAITADGLINALYSLNAAYQANASWLFHRDGVKMIRKLKDGNGQYIWAPGLVAGQPDTLLNRPLYQSEFAPNTFTTGLRVGIVGDFKFLYIQDALTLSIQRLVELYARTNEVGFLARFESDAAPVKAEAFARVKLA